MATLFIVLFLMAIIPAKWQGYVWEMLFSRLWPNSCLKHNIDLAVSKVKEAKEKITTPKEDVK